MTLNPTQATKESPGGLLTGPLALLCSFKDVLCPIPSRLPQPRQGHAEAAEYCTEPAIYLKLSEH